MKNSQSGMARNWDEDEGELFDDPLSDEEYADTQAMESWLEELEERVIRAEQRRKKLKAPKGLENILYNIYEEINDIKNTVYKFESGYNAGFYIWKYGKYYIATRPYENGKYISYLLYFEPFEVKMPENYRFYINGNASTAAIIELAAIKTLIHKNFACCNWKKEVVNNFGIAYHRKSKEAQK